MTVGSPPKVSEGGLLMPGFSADGFRQLVYVPNEHQLVVIAPQRGDKTTLKMLGGMWRRKKPRGWVWRFSEQNLKKLLENVPFNVLDSRIEQVIEEENKHLEIIRRTKQAALVNQETWLRVPGLKTNEERLLRNYQKLGIQFGVTAKYAYLNSDEMGLGKTVISLSVALWKKHREGAMRCLIIAPASVKYNWKEEIELWTDEPYTVIEGSAKQRTELWEQETFFTITNPELIVRDASKTPSLQRPWDLIIIDEIHMIKSWWAQRSQEIKRLELTPNGLKIGLSGTPIDGRLEDLHSIFEFLTPHLFPRRSQFLARYAKKDFYGSIIGYEHVDEVRETIAPFFLRRLKKNVANELPDKVFKTVYVDLSTKERQFYKDLVKKKHEITEEAEPMTIVLRARQYCDAPGLLGERPQLGSKYKVASQVLKEMIDSGHKVLVFSMWEKMVQLLLAAFQETGWRCLSVTGATSQKDRPALARKFNEDPNIDLCVMDEAGSTGLNFQEASYVLHYDDNWAPAIMKQRTDRAHRLTTKHTVTVVNFVCRNTIEDRVRNKLTDKDHISADALGDDFNEVAAIRSMTEKDVFKLL